MRELSASVLAATAVFALPFCVGCEHHHHEHETVYVQGSVPPQGYVVTTAPPPPVVVEPQAVAPAPGYVWVDGYWHWTGHEYAWHKGYWAVPPRGYHHWVAPRYEHHEREYHYVPGRWER